MHWVWITLGVTLFILCILLSLHAFEHSGYGCAWLAFFILFPVVSQLIYAFILFYSNRPDQIVRQQAGEKTDQQFFSRFPNEIEKARFIEAADRSVGTMYEAEPSSMAMGYAHFNDNRADLLLNEGRLDEAWEYLIDLYDLSKSEGHGRREDTYLHYISRLPDGQARLAKWRQEKRLQIGGGSDDQPPPSGPLPNRDVPF